MLRCGSDVNCPMVGTLQIAAAITLPMTHQSDTASCLTPTVAVTAVMTIHFVASLMLLKS